MHNKISVFAMYNGLERSNNCAKEVGAESGGLAKVRRGLQTKLGVSAIRSEFREH
jgi:hypothetical protein